MPELPEAQTIAAQLDRCLRGARLTRVTLRRRDIVHGPADVLRRELPGRCVRHVARRGKRVVVHLDSGAVLVFRLGMTGQIIVTDPGTPRDRHVHLRLELDDGRELRFRDVRRFGGLWFTPDHGVPLLSEQCDARDARSAKMSVKRTTEPSRDREGAVLLPRRRSLPHGRGSARAFRALSARPAGLDDLGPEPLELSAAQFARLLDRPRQIKALLLDQRAVAGLGNIYTDEALFAAGIHPLTSAADLTLPQRRALWRAVRRILRQAVRAGGSTLRNYRTADGDEGSFQTRHRVYGRTGQQCHNCGTQIQRLLAAGRSSHVCPTCQPHPQGPLCGPMP